MATSSRRNSRPSASPSRAARSRVRSRQTSPARTPEASGKQTPIEGARRTPFALTSRFLILMVTIAALFFTYLTTLRVYINQSRQIAVLEQSAAEHRAEIDELQKEVDRWQDPEFVKTQARERLGWVIPGERGYRVVDADGNLYGGGQQIGQTTLPDGEYAKTWWDKMWGSVLAADDPVADEDAQGDASVNADGTRSTATDEAETAQDLDATGETETSDNAVASEEEDG